ncbi:hypothetical protein ACPB8Q_04970 [Methanocaldococcus indicus]|uniref:hypothetical protein n=1 Tax=Methanocaldococcus indicus TaxID=213231 RepID=UPI003C6D6106
MDWISKAIKHPGSLRKKLHGHLGRVIIGATKKPIFTKSGDININTLKQFRTTRAYHELDKITKQQINLAITLRRIRK